MVVRPYRPLIYGVEVCIILFYFFFQIILPSRSGVYKGLADKTVHIIQETISRQLTANKSFKRGSSFCRFRVSL